MAVLQELFSDSRHIWRIDRRLVTDLNSDLFDGDLGLPNTFRISIELALDACGEIRILDLDVCDVGTCIWASDDMYPRQAYRLSKKFKNTCGKIPGGALWHTA